MSEPVKARAMHAVRSEDPGVLTDRVTDLLGSGTWELLGGPMYACGEWVQFIVILPKEPGP